MTNFADLLIEALPSGSGFDTDWAYVVQNNGLIVFSSGYHCMDEHGYYCGWCYFKIRLDLLDPLDFKLNFVGKQSTYLNEKYCLREYMEDTINYHIDDWLRSLDTSLVE